VLEFIASLAYQWATNSWRFSMENFAQRPRVGGTLVLDVATIIKIVVLGPLIEEFVYRGLAFGCLYHAYDSVSDDGLGLRVPTPH
jgi:membrane protease YdiL (CAAX protease family)